MAKQTFTTGQVLTAAQMTALQQTAMLGGDANARTASYVLVAGDAGNAITMSSTSATTITVNTGIFAAGDIVTIVNINTGVCTISAGTATVTTSGSLALAANQGGVLRFTSASAAIFLQFATPASGDIEGITTGANSGLTGGVTSGTADLKLNFTAKGQLAVGTGSGTTGFLTVGSNGQYIVADSATSTGLKWEAPAAGGAYTSIATGSLSSNAVNITSISGSYTDLYLVIKDFALNADGDFSFRFNNDTTSNRHFIYGGTYIVGGAANSVTSVGTSVKFNYNNIDSPDADNQFVLRVNNYSVAQKHSGELWSVYTATSSAQEFYFGWIGYTDTTAITEINLLTNQTFSGGTYTLYGVK